MKGFRIIIFVLVTCYMFSFGMFCAHIYNQITSRKSLNAEIQKLNELSDQQREKYNAIIKMFSSIPEIKTHLQALQDKIPKYEYEKVLFQIKEVDEVKPFKEKLLNYLSFNSDSFEAFAISTEILYLDRLIEDQQAIVIKKLTY